MTDKPSEGVRKAVAGLPKRAEPTDDNKPSEGKGPRGDERGMIRQTLYLPPAVHQALRDYAHTQEISQQALLRRILSTWLEKVAGAGTWDELEKKGSK